jgi:hypothetical protein
MVAMATRAYPEALVETVWSAPIATPRAIIAPTARRRVRPTGGSPAHGAMTGADEMTTGIIDERRAAYIEAMVAIP